MAPRDSLFVSLPPSLYNLFDRPAKGEHRFRYFLWNVSTLLPIALLFPFNTFVPTPPVISRVSSVPASQFLASIPMHFLSVFLYLSMTIYYSGFFNSSWISYWIGDTGVCVNRSLIIGMKYLSFKLFIIVSCYYRSFRTLIFQFFVYYSTSYWLFGELPREYAIRGQCISDFIIRSSVCQKSDLSLPEIYREDYHFCFPKEDFLVSSFLCRTDDIQLRHFKQ